MQGRRLIINVMAEQEKLEEEIIVFEKQLERLRLKLRANKTFLKEIKKLEE